jgi:hypothetical protein
MSAARAKRQRPTLDDVLYTAPHEHTVGIRQLYKVDLPTEAMSVENRDVEGHC